MRASRMDDNKNALIWKILVAVLSLVVVGLVLVVLMKDADKPRLHTTLEKLWRI